MSTFNRLRVTLVLHKWPGKYGVGKEYKNSLRLNSLTVPTFTRLTDRNEGSQYIEVILEGIYIATLSHKREGNWTLSAGTTWLRAPVGSPVGISWDGKKSTYNENFASLQEAVDYLLERARVADLPGYWPMVLKKEGWVVDPKFLLFNHDPFATRELAMAFVHDHADITKAFFASRLSPGEEYLPKIAK